MCGLGPLRVCVYDSAEEGHSIILSDAHLEKTPLTFHSWKLCLFSRKGHLHSEGGKRDRFLDSFLAEGQSLLRIVK